MGKYIIGLDQGAIKSRAMLFASDATVVTSSSRKFGVSFPAPGWVEHPPNAMWQTMLKCIQELFKTSGVPPNDITAIGISNQGGTTLLWDRKTGEPFCNAIVWQCRRTSHMCQELVNHGLSKLIHQRTGLVPDPIFSATKLKWLLEHTPGIEAKLKKTKFASVLWIHGSFLNLLECMRQSLQMHP
ncbi:MAG: hypothetical protein GY750_10470 [Lentisphaerae bacterium]|nr:hypothetical protein [Lentisphaerota bacterium]MCP4101835.1 hypothetical protein [Lentisphaerota bacterium]